MNNQSFVKLNIQLIKLFKKIKLNCCERNETDNGLYLLPLFDKYLPPELNSDKNRQHSNRRNNRVNDGHIHIAVDKLGDILLIVSS
jgi:hypothetical protein